MIDEAKRKYSRLCLALYRQRKAQHFESGRKTRIDGTTHSHNSRCLVTDKKQEQEA